VADRALADAIILPGENNTGLPGIGDQPPEEDQVDVLNIYDDSSEQDQTGVLTATGLTGFNMAGPLQFSGTTSFGEPNVFPGGISFGTIRVGPDGKLDTDSTQSTIEVVNIMLGQGNDHLTIQSTLNPGPGRNGVPVATHGGLTVVHGGG